MSKTNQNQKVAIVTGGASGIGRATALRFAKMRRGNSIGCSVIVADRNSVDGQHTVDLIRNRMAAVSSVLTSQRLKRWKL